MLAILLGIALNLCHINGQTCPSGEFLLTDPKAVRHGATGSDVEWTSVSGVIYSTTLTFDVTTHTLNNHPNKPVIRTRTHQGAIPCITLRMERGNTYKVTLVNALGDNDDINIDDLLYPNIPHHFNSTNIHTHGLHVGGGTPAPGTDSEVGDNVFITINPGETREYTYRIPCTHSGGLFFYHPHHHGSVDNALTHGAGGPIIIEDDQTREALPDWYVNMKTMIFWIHHLDIGRIRQTDENNENNFNGITDDVWQWTANGAGEPDLYLINGQYQPTVCQNSNEWIKLRFGIIERDEPRHFYIHDGSGTNCAVQLLSRDGVIIQDPPRSVGNVIWLTQSSRADVAIYCAGDVSGTKIYNIYSGDATNTGDTIIAYIEVTGTDTSATINIPTAFVPNRPNYLEDLRAYTGPLPTATRDGVIVTGSNIAGQTFESETTYFANLNINTVNTWEITEGNDNGAHPFHMHVNHFQLIDENPEIVSDATVTQHVPPTGYQQIGDWYDTLWGPGHIRFKTDIWAGTVAAHCHIPRHGDEGAIGTALIGSGCNNDYTDYNGVSGSCTYDPANPPSECATLQPTQTTNSPSDKPTSSPIPTAQPIPTPTSSPAAVTTPPTSSPVVPTPQPVDTPCIVTEQQGCITDCDCCDLVEAYCKTDGGPPKCTTQGPEVNSCPNPTIVPTKSPSGNPSTSPTKAPSDNPSTSPTKSPTQVPSGNPSTSPTKNPSQAPSDNPTTSPTKSPTKSPTQSPSDNPSGSPTKSPTSNPSAAPTKQPTDDPSRSPTKSPTKSPTNNPSTSPTQPPSDNPSGSPIKPPTNNPTQSPSGNPSTSPTQTPSDNPTTSPTKSPTGNPSSSPTQPPSDNPTASPTKNPTVSPVDIPSTSPTKSPTGNPSQSPSGNPTAPPTRTPTNDPSTSPIKSPTDNPSTSPTKSPSVNPSTSPSEQPTSSPTEFPSLSPSNNPIESPSYNPSTSPTVNPTESPSGNPTASPTRTPTDDPSTSPIKSPTDNPTQSDDPSASPTKSPTDNPSTSPTKSPSDNPSTSPSKQPTSSPTELPSDNPTQSPSNNPSTSPTKNPTGSPTNNPSTSPTKSPTKSPTGNPTQSPSGNPTASPTRTPTDDPSTSPIKSPSDNPTGSPSNNPTTSPSDNPTQSPTKQPTTRPTNVPSVSPTKNPTSSPVQCINNEEQGCITDCDCCDLVNDYCKTDGGPPKCASHGGIGNNCDNPSTSPTKAPSDNPITPGSPTNNPIKSPTQPPSPQCTANGNTCSGDTDAGHSECCSCYCRTRRGSYECRNAPNNYDLPAQCTPSNAFSASSSSAGGLFTSSMTSVETGITSLICIIIAVVIIALILIIYRKCKQKEKENVIHLELDQVNSDGGNDNVKSPNSTLEMSPNSTLGMMENEQEAVKNVILNGENVV